MSDEIGRTGLALVGVTAGFILGGPVGASIGLAFGTAAGYFLFPPEGKAIEGRRLDDLSVSFSSYGRPQPRIYGTMETGGNVVWSPGLKEHRVTEELGGKGTPSVTRVSFLYTASWRINYSVGVADAILKTWADNKLIRDFTGTGPVQNFFALDGPGAPAIRDFLGTATQLPGPAEQADKGVANTSAYRGTVGQEYEDHPLENYGNRIPQISSEISMEATETFPLTTLSDLSPSGANWAWQTKGETFLISSMTRVDNINQSVIISNGDIGSNPVVPAVDSNGDFYTATTSFGLTIGRCRKWSGTTLQLLATGNEFKDPFTGAGIGSSLSWGKGRIFGGIVAADGTIIGELLFLQRTSTATTIIVDPRVIATSASGGIINKYSTAAELDGSLAVDSERHLWGFYNLAGDTILVRIRPGDGAVSETHTIVGDTHDLLTYDNLTNSLVLGNASSHLLRWSLDTETVVARLDGISFENSKNSSEFWNGPNNGRLYLQTGAITGTFQEFDIINMVAGQSWNPGTDFGADTTLTHRGIYDPLRHAMIKRKDTGGIIYWLLLNRMSGDNITVRSIVEDVSSLIDYVAGTDIDATALTDTLPGYIVRTRMTARKALEPLATAFNFRSVESDWMIKFPKRGGASVGNIPQIDLGATIGEVPTTQALKKTRIAEDQLFETAIIEYIDPTFDNNPNTQQAKRSAEAIDVGGSLKFEFPGALGNDQAAQIIERMLFQAWSGRTKVATTLPLKHVLKDPGDVVTLTKDGKTITLEIIDIKLGANSIIQMEGLIDDSVIHLSTATGAGALGVETQVIPLTGLTDFFIMDIPLLRDLDDGSGIYIAAGTSGNASWPGASIRRGLDPVNLSPLTAVASARDMDYGFATEALADADPDVFDRDNTLNIHLFSGVLSSSTETAVLNGANPLLVGTGSKAEVIQFVTAVLETAGTDTVSTLLRGRRGTEYATGTHVLGDEVVVLSTSTVLRVGLDLSDHLSIFFYRVITLGNALPSGKTVEESLLLRSQMPYAPSHVAGSIAADEWTITFVRRTRIGGSWKDLVDVPVGEGSESYEVDIMSGATVKRTLASATESVTYTSADQVTDFGGNQTTIEVNVYQLSTDVSRGFVTNKTLVGS